MRSADYAMARCLSVRLYVWLSHAGIVCKRLYIPSKSFHHRVAPPWSVEWRHLNFQWPSTSLNQISRARHYSCTCVLTIKLISFCRPILYDMRVVGILESWNRWRLTDSAFTTSAGRLFQLLTTMTEGNFLSIHQSIHPSTFISDISP